VRRSDTTTTDFGAVPPADLQRAVELLNQGNVDPAQEFVLHQVFDAEGTPSWEISCRCCGGLGHIAKHCPSEKKFRSFDYIIKMATDSKERAETRGAERGHPPGGKRGMPRGQRAPYKPFPRNFEQKVGPRRSFSSATRTRPNQARSAEEGYQSEESEAAATVVHGRVSTEEKNEEVKDAKEVVLQREPGRLMPKLFRDDDFFSSEAAKVASASDVPAASLVQAAPEDEEQCMECEPPEEAEEEAAPANDAPAGPRPQAPPGAPRGMGYVGMLGMGLVAGMNVTLLVTLLVLAMAKPAGALQLSPQGAMRAAPPGWHAPRAASRVYNPPRTTFDVIEQVLEIRECDLEFGLDVGLDELPQRDPTGDSSLIYATVDSGATIICISEYDEWMIDGVVDAAPRVGVEVADGVHLTTKTIGTVNSGGPHRGRLGLSAHECTWSAEGEPTLMAAGVSYPQLSRVHVVKGLKQGTRLLGVRPLRRDGHQAFFNEDNGAKLEDCLRLKDGRYVLFTNDEKRYEVAFHANQGDESAFAARDSQRSGLEVHASLMHACTRRIKRSLIHISGFDLTTLDVEGSDCRGCRFGKTVKYGRKHATAPSRGGSAIIARAPVGTQTRVPSTAKYSFFGQRFDSDLAVKLTRSWPHGFTAYIDYCDRHTAEVFYGFLQRPNGAEVASSTADLLERLKPRLQDGRVHRWHVDNDQAFDGPDIKGMTEALIGSISARVPYDPNTNPVAERHLGLAKEGARGALEYAGANECLWPWAITQYANIRYFIATSAHDPEISPYEFAHGPGAPAADLSWAKPLFCDVTVHLVERDRHGALSSTGADGCYLLHDMKRGCEIVYVPKMRRIASFEVTDWRPHSFTIVKGITTDTPVEYMTPADLQFGPETASLMPKHIRASTAAVEAASAWKKEGVGTVDDQLAENARRIEHGLKALEQEGDAAFIETATEESRHDAVAASVSCEAGRSSVEPLFEVTLHGSEQAKQVVAAAKVLKYASVKEAQESPYWQMIKTEMEHEMAGKIANGFAEVVKREPGMHCLKVKWVIDVFLSDDGSVLRVKARLVACGYTQVEGLDYDEVFAHTLPGVCFRLFSSILADEDLEDDQIDAVKAFTQAKLDRPLYAEMPEGFRYEGFVMLLLMALEGIKQGAMLWFKKNKWAWNQCGMFADLSEPNLYTHATLPFVAAVFADDVGCGFHRSARKEYMAMKAAYGKLIKIDNPVPDTTNPLSLFTGCELHRDRQAKTIKVTQSGYIRKLAARFAGKYKLQDLPYGASKAKRDEFEGLKPGTAETAVDPHEYLVKLGSVGWPTQMTRPECAFTYTQECSLSMAPTQEAHDAVMHTIGYLINTAGMGPVYGGRLRIPFGLRETPPWFEEARGLYSVTDSSWGKTPRPFGGHVVMRMNAAVDWSAKAFKMVVPASTAEAETAEASRATKRTLACRNVLAGARRSVVGPTTLLGDNDAMMKLVMKDGTSQLTRYFERATMLVKYAVLRLMIAVELVSTKEMIADVFTKAVDKETFALMRKHLLNQVEDKAYKATHTRASRLAGKLAEMIGNL